MSWVTPKIDWISSNYFNIEDWDRVTGNVEYLTDQYEYFQLRLEYLGDLNLDKGIYSLPYVTLINILERSLTQLFNVLDDHVILQIDWAGKTWYDRKDESYTSNPNYTDWIRWEKLLAEVYSIIIKFVKMQYISNEFISGEV